MKMNKALLALIAPFFLMAACGGPSGTSSGSGSTHNAGRDCASCHGDLEYAGTVYSSDRSTRVSGVKVIVEQSDGKVITMTSDQSGNFWSESGDAGKGYTARIEGNSVNMTTTATYGGCNRSGCHDGKGVDRVYVN